MRRSRTGWLLALPFAVAPCALSQAGPPTVELKIESRDLYVREAVALALEVGNFQATEAPQLPEVPGALLRLLPGTSDSSQTFINNGRMQQSRTRTYNLELIPHAPGPLTIPPITLVVDGEPRRTRAYTLNVRPSDADQLFAADISAGRSRVYVGQRVPVTMTIWIKPARFRTQLADPADMLRQVRPVEFGPFPLQVSNMGRRQRPGAASTDLYYAYDFITDFVPERPGPLTFNDIDIGLAYPSGGTTRNLRARPTVQPIDVLPVPQDGRPPNYNGAVGLFQITTAADPTLVRVGDPIELTIEIFGDGPIASLPPPLLSDNPALNDGFRLPAEQLAGELHDARRRYRLTIRARREDVHEIPALEYPYFDPNFERFVMARSTPIPVTVLPAAEAALPEAAAPGTGGSPASPAVLQALDGLRDIETSEQALLASAAPVMSSHVLAALAVPAGAFLLTWAGVAYAQRRAADPTRRRRQAALRTARARLTCARRLSPRDSAAEVRATLAAYLADRTAQPAARFEGGGAADYLRSRNVPNTVADQWAAVIRSCDEAVYAPGSVADGETLRLQALDCLKAAERHKP